MISLDNLLSPKEASDRVIVAFAFSNQCELLFYFILTFSFNLSFISISLQCRFQGLKMFSFSLDSIHLLILVFLRDDENDDDNYFWHIKWNKPIYSHIKWSIISALNLIFFSSFFNLIFNLFHEFHELQGFWLWKQNVSVVSKFWLDTWSRLLFFPKVYVRVEVKFRMYYPRLPHSTLNMAT